MRILLIGGAGYIGSTLANRLIDRGHTPVVYDDLSTGFRDAVPAGVVLIEGDTGNAALLGQTIKANGIDAAIHLAAHIRVDESVSFDPGVITVSRSIGLADHYAIFCTLDTNLRSLPTIQSY